jgi:hypothetical protein
VSEATTPPVAGSMPEVIEAEPAQQVGQPDTSIRSDRARSAAYRSRFVIVYVGIALVASVGIGALIVSLMKPDKAPPAPSATQFTPSRAGELGALELAENVQQKYRLANGDELVSVVASRNTLQDGNLGLIRVRFQYVQPFDADKESDSKLVTPKNAIQYSLCGTSGGCAIPGTPSPGRFALLKRQALELAVRTFQNDTEVDNVAVFLRPVAADPAWEGYALVFARAEVNRAQPLLLSRSLGETLPDRAKTMTQMQLKAAQVKRIDQLTRPYLYLFRYQLLGGRDALMQLQPAKV